MLHTSKARLRGLLYPTLLVILVYCVGEQGAQLCALFVSPTIYVRDSPRRRALLVCSTRIYMRAVLGR